MSKFFVILRFLCCLCVLTCLFPQNSSSTGRWARADLSSRYYPSVERLSADVAFLSDTLLQGRSRGTAGHAEAAFYIYRRFLDLRLLPVGASYCHSFKVRDTANNAGHNIIGMLEGRNTGKNDRYVIVGAHYDHLGTIKGSVYPGADSNASGVAAVMGIASFMRHQREMCLSYGANVIFVAFDANMQGRTGASALWQDIAAGRMEDPLNGRKITPSKILMMIDIDQIGSALSPPRGNIPEYVIALGADSLPGVSGSEFLSTVNWEFGCNLDVSESYYGSRRFTDLFYHLGNRKVFVEHNVPTLYFTSGITCHNNKTTDTWDTLDYDVMQRRIVLISRLIEEYIKQ